MKPDEKWLKLDFGLLTPTKGSVYVSHPHCTYLVG